MPRYDFICDVCGCRFEIQRPMSETYLVRCPKCKGKSEQVFSPPALNMFPIKNATARMNGKVLWEA